MKSLKKRINKKILCGLAFFLTAVLAFLFFFIAREEYKEGQTAEEALQVKRCGLDALYLALKWLALAKPELSPDYHQLTKLYPKVEETGMTLTQVKNFLEQKHISSSTSFLTRRELERLHEDVIVFALENRKDAPHIFLVRKGKSVNKVQVVDPQRNLFGMDVLEKEISVVEKEKLFGLFVSVDERHLPKKSFLFPICMLGVFLLGIILFVAQRKKDRVQEMKITVLFAAFLLFLSVFTGCSRERDSTEKNFSYPRTVAFGRLPLKEGIAIAEKTITITNKTDSIVEILEAEASCSCLEVKVEENKIPAKGTTSLRLKITLTPDYVFGRLVTVFVLLKDHPPLSLNVTGESGFSTYTPQRAIDFGEIHSFESARVDFPIFATAPKLIPKPIKKCEYEGPGLFKIEIEDQKVQRGKPSESGETAYLNSSVVTLSFHPDMKMPAEGAASGKLKILLYDDKQLEIPVRWNYVKRPVFEPAVGKMFLANPDMSPEFFFSVIYNEASGGESKKISVTPTTFSIVSERRANSSVFIRLKCDWNSLVKAKSEKLGTLRVETANGTSHVLDFIPSEN